jgi:hypothetical protein
MDNYQTEIDLEQLDIDLKYFVYKWTKGDDEGNICVYDNIYKDPVSGIVWINFKDGSRINYALLDEFMIRLEENQITQPKTLPAVHTHKNVILADSPQNIQHTQLNPIVSLLEKQKPNWIEVGIKLKLNLPTESLYGVLSNSFENAEEEIIEFVVRDLDIELVKQSLRNQIKEIYRGNGNNKKSRGNISAHTEEY